VKVTTALMLARYFSKPRQAALSMREIIIGGVILAIPAGLIMLEPDAGSVLTYLPLLVVTLFLSSLRMWLVIAALVLSVVAVPAAYIVGVKAGLIKIISRSASTSFLILSTPTNAALGITHGNPYWRLAKVD
jgi:rod shape determining protein RodA